MVQNMFIGFFCMRGIIWKQRHSCTCEPERLPYASQACSPSRHRSSKSGSPPDLPKNTDKQAGMMKVPTPALGLWFGLGGLLRTILKLMRGGKEAKEDNPSD